MYECMGACGEGPVSGEDWMMGDGDGSAVWGVDWWGMGLRGGAGWIIAHKGCGTGKSSNN